MSDFGPEDRNDFDHVAYLRHRARRDGPEDRNDFDRAYVERPDSTNIKSLTFDYGRLIVEFRNGGVYSYEPCAGETFRAIASAPSAGKAFHHHIRKAPSGTYTVTNLHTGDDEEDRPLQPRLDGEPGDTRLCHDGQHFFNQDQQCQCGAIRAGQPRLDGEPERHGYHP